MTNYKKIYFIVFFMIILISCNFFTDISQIATPTTIPTPTLTPTPLPSMPVEPGEANPNEPVFITGEIPYTSRFFLNTISRPFVLLEDQAGFVRRDREFQFTLNSQVIGPVVIHPDEKLTYSLSLPAVPQGTFVDVDNDSQVDTGVQVFAVAYWSNTWGDSFLERRDGTGWSTAYASTIADPNLDGEIQGGTLIIWAPDDQQEFPTSFGEDGLLFTQDDPVVPVPAGSSLVDLDQTPFRFYKESEPRLTLNEGVLATNDYSKDTYKDAFQKMFDKVSREYPFTEEKSIDWQALYQEYIPQVEAAKNKEEFYQAIRYFTYEIPDGHVRLSINPDVFYKEGGGGVGLVLTELSDGKVIASQVLSGKPASKAGIKPGAEILSWNDQPVLDAIETTIPYFSPYSTAQTQRIEQAEYLTRVPPGSRIDVTFKNPDEAQEKKVALKAEIEYDSLFMTIPGYNQDILALPIEASILDDSGLGHIRINTFSDDYNLMASIWDRQIQLLIDEKIPGLIIDLRENSGGSMSLALDFAGYFFDNEFTLYQSEYYSYESGEFETTELPAKVKPGPITFKAPVAVLVGPDCVSACEGFAFALQQNDRAIIFGNYPTAGAFGEVGRGQYQLPDDLSIQFPTGRPISMDGNIVIEGVGIEPDTLVPVTLESALGQVDSVLEAAVQALLEKIK